MTIEVHAVQRIRAYVESTFGADSSGSAGSFTDLPIREGSAQLTLVQASMDPRQLVQHIDEYRKEVLGARKGTKLTFTMNLAPTGTAAGAATAAVQGPLGLILKTVLGGETLGTGTTFTGGTATVPTVTSAAGLLAGGAIGWTNSSGILEVREIKSISGSSVTLAHAFSGAPSNGNVCYAAATYFPTANPSGSLAFLVEGLESDDRWLLTGGQCVDGYSIAVDPSGGAIPSITFNMQFANWYASDECGSSITGTLGTATYTYHEPIVGYAGEYRVFTTEAPTLLTTSIVHASAIVFAPALKYVPYTSPLGTQTIVRWVKMREAPAVSGGFTGVYQDTTWWNARKNRGTYNPCYTYGTAAGSAVLLSARSVQMMNPQRGPDPAGLAGQILQWKGRRNIDTAATTDQATAPYAIHLV